jgi:hypothetical protein
LRYKETLLCEVTGVSCYVLKRQADYGVFGMKHTTRRGTTHSLPIILRRVGEGGKITFHRHAHLLIMSEGYPSGTLMFACMRVACNTQPYKDMRNHPTYQAINNRVLECTSECLLSLMSGASHTSQSAVVPQRVYCRSECLNECFASLRVLPFPDCLTEYSLNLVTKYLTVFATAS